MGKSGEDEATGDGKKKTTRRERIVRILWAVGGALGAAVLALAVNVATPFAIDLLDGESAPPVADRPGCDAGTSPNVAGEVRLGIYLSKPDENCWQISLDGVLPGDTFDALVEVRNFTGDLAENVQIQVQPWDGLELVAGTTVVGNVNAPEGRPTPADTITGNGLNIGELGHGGNAWVIFTLRMDETFQLPCGLATAPVYARLPFQAGQEDLWEGAAVVTKRHCSAGDS